MIKNFKPRLYQETIFGSCIKYNTLVVLPTGLGKTNIFLMAAAHRLDVYPKSKILLLGPTKPLIDQYYYVFKKYFKIEEDNMAEMTGKTSPEKRKELWESKKILFATPQTVENDIISGYVPLEKFSLIGFDEAHRAVKKYSYVWIAQQYHKKANYERIMAMTASPGDNLESIKETCRNLFIEKIEVRTENDPDVKPYIQEVDMDRIMVELPEAFNDIISSLKICYKNKLKQIKQMGFLYGRIDSYTKKALINFQGSLQGKVAQGEKSPEIWKSISLTAEAFKAYHALDLIETQNLAALNEYFKKVEEEAEKGKTRAVKNLLQDIYFKSAIIRTRKLIEKNIEHPKLTKLKEIIKENKDKKIIIFTEYRDSGVKIVEDLNKISTASLFVGQAKKKDTGLTQKNQKEVLDKFREDKFNILVSTSIGEEGLDIPSVDIVIFYEPIPSVIRRIQRKGRTGRLEKGRLVVLISKGTRDETYGWVVHHKEKRMYRAIKLLRKKLLYDRVLEQFSDDVPERKKTKKKNMNEIKNNKTEEKKIVIYIDHRERNSLIVKKLVEFGVNIGLKNLEVGDYLLGGDVAVEYKTCTDFVDSIIDGRILKQAKELKKYKKPVFIIEGEEDIFSLRKIHPNAIRGMLATISVSYGIPILQTRTPYETASLMHIIAKRMQEDEDREFVYHTLKPQTLKEQQEYIVSALPNIGTKLARPLLKKFKTVKKIINASEEQLQKIDLIGPKKAKSIKEVVDKEYKE